MKPEIRLKTDQKRAAPRTAFQPGQSGNPGGRRKKTAEEFELEHACELNAPEALETVLEIMRDSKNDKVRLDAASFVIERRYGKSVTKIEDVTDPFKKALGNMSAEDAQEMLDALERVRVIHHKAKSAA